VILMFDISNELSTKALEIKGFFCFIPLTEILNNIMS